MRRGLRVALAASATAGCLVLGAGSAYAGNDYDSGSGGSSSSDDSDDDDGHGHYDKKADCSSKVDKDKKLREDQFPSDNHLLALQNVTPLDAKDGHGQPYYLHNDMCNSNKPWRGHDWDDKSYDTFKYKIDKKTGEPHRDPKKNTYYDNDGYNKSFKKDRKDLEPDRIGGKFPPKEEPK